MMKQRWLLTFGFLFSVGTVGSAQSLLDGTPFNASIYNLPDSVGAVRLIDTAGSDCRSDEGVPGFDVVPVEECLISDSGIDPVMMTFNGGPQNIGGNLTVNPTAKPFGGLDEPIVVFNAESGLTVPLPVWEREGDLLEFTMRTRDNSYPAEDEEDFWGFAAEGITYPNADPEAQIGIPLDEELNNYTNFYFWYENEDGPIKEYDIFLDAGIGVGKHPEEDRDVVFILYSTGQTDEQTDTLPGGIMDFHSHGSILDSAPQIGNLFVLADFVGVEDPFGVTGFGLGFLVEPPPTVNPGVPGDFNGDEQLTAEDIDLLSAQVGMGDLTYDLNGDGAVTDDDRQVWINDLVGTILGDTNLDKSVDFPDFLALSDAFGEAGGWASGDSDGNGEIGFPDFLALSNNFGMTATAAAVPEPTTASLAALAGLALLPWRRRR